jgi:hypothetical protein
MIGTRVLDEQCDAVGALSVNAWRCRQVGLERCPAVEAVLARQRVLEVTE